MVMVMVMVNVDLYSAIITKVSRPNALDTLVSGEKPGFQTLSEGLVVLLCAEVVRQRVLHRQRVQDYSDPAVQRFREVTCVVHEDYTPPSYDSDIALVRLPTALRYSDYVLPVCLPSSPAPAGTSCVVAGWGNTQGERRDVVGQRSLRGRLPNL